MKTFTELNFEEQQEVTSLFSAWLRPYTSEVVNKIMEQADDIINNDFAVDLLRELAKRQDQEIKDFDESIEMLFRDFETFSKYDAHNHPLSHASSYRDVLHDMYIKNH